MNIRAINRSMGRLAGLSLVLVGAMGFAQVASADPITRVYIVQVPPAQDHAFNVGVKAWEKCLRDHGTKDTTYAYDAETGDATRYVFLAEYSSWGGMDVHDAAGKACMGLFRSGVSPHFSGVVSDVAVPNAKDTYMPGGDPDPAPMIWVDAFRIKFGQAAAFNDALSKFAAAAAKTHWQGHFAGYDIEGGGQGSEDFVLVWPNKSWADIGTDPNPSAKAMMQSVYGAAAQSMHQTFVQTVAEEWSDAWSYDKDLSVIPGK